MTIEVDHVFIGCRRGAPEAEALLRQGFVEGSANTHPDQGTANRRFFFDGFMLELLWVVDEADVTSALTRRTRLWDRCSNPSAAECPFGIVFRAEDPSAPPPFQTWAYAPTYLPAGASMGFALGTTLQEPELICMPPRRTPMASAERRNHTVPIGTLHSVAVGVRKLAALSEAALATQRLGKVRYFESEQALLDLTFEGDSDASFDFRPVLPLLLRVQANPAAVDRVGAAAAG